MGSLGLPIPFQLISSRAPDLVHLRKRQRYHHLKLSRWRDSGKRLTNLGRLPLGHTVVSFWPGFLVSAYDDAPAVGTVTRVPRAAAGRGEMPQARSFPLALHPRCDGGCGAGVDVGALAASAPGRGGQVGEP